MLISMTNKGFIALMVLALSYHALTMDMFSFYVGDNAEITFSPQTDPDDFEVWKMFRDNGDGPFYTDGRINTRGLSLDQHDRFAVSIFQIGTNVTVKLLITAIRKTDEDIYILNSNGSKLLATVEVLRPLGPAECDIIASSDVCLVYCEANTGDVNGTIDCYQKDVEVRPVPKTVRPGNTVIGIFHMMCGKPIHCCSSKVDHPKNFDICTDVVSLSYECPDVKDSTVNTVAAGYFDQNKTTLPPQKTDAGYRKITLICLSVMGVLIGLLIMYILVLRYKQYACYQRITRNSETHV